MRGRVGWGLTEDQRSGRDLDEESESGLVGVRDGLRRELDRSQAKWESR